MRMRSPIMKRRLTALALVTALPAAALAVACSNAYEEAAGDSQDAVTTFSTIKPEWKGPTPGTTNNDLDGRLVLKGWRTVAKVYSDKAFMTYDGQGKEITPPAGFAFPDGLAEATQCLGNPVPWWSDLAIHFYCWNPSYLTVSHNVRGCFSYVPRSPQGPVNQHAGLPDGGLVWSSAVDGGAAVGTPVEPDYAQRILFYPEVYDYCLYQDYDQSRTTALQRFNVYVPNPEFDTAVIDRNKRSGTKPGVMRWVDANAEWRETFKHVMFTWYDPDTYDWEQQQEIINQFYGVNLQGKTSYTTQDAALVQECITKRPRRQGDPGDGTHCSTSKTLQKTKARNYAESVRYMQTQVVTKSYTATRVQPGD